MLEYFSPSFSIGSKEKPHRFNLFKEPHLATPTRISGTSGHLLFFYINTSLYNEVNVLPSSQSLTKEDEHGSEHGFFPPHFVGQKTP